MSGVGFEPTIPVFERAKTVHVLGRAATVIGYGDYTMGNAHTYLPTYLPIYLSMALQPFVGPWQLYQFIDLFSQPVGFLGRGSARRKAATYTKESTNTE
jgi:hypothetical protein